jgi:alkanesulfonate monooxygenase SsuD/methylene tetrahydromethanopterin reductase-like flavin-dependent oxidoreductase (luciferase family)
MLSLDLSRYPPDEPLPDPPPAGAGSAGHYESIVAMALTREPDDPRAGARVAGARGKNTIHGSPKRVADYMEEWFTARP